MPKYLTRSVSFQIVVVVVAEPAGASIVLFGGAGAVSIVVVGVLDVGVAFVVADTVVVVVVCVAPLLLGPRLPGRVHFSFVYLSTF